MSGIKIVAASYAGRPPAYHLALALLEANKLERFVTSAYFKKSSVKDRFLKSLLPKAAARSVLGLDGSEISSYWTLDAVRYAAAALPFHKELVQQAQAFLFDAIVSLHLKRSSDWLVAPTGECASVSFPKAGRMGIRRAVLCVAPPNMVWGEVAEREQAVRARAGAFFRDQLDIDRRIWECRQKEYSQAELFISISPFISEGLEREGISRDRIHTIPMGCDMSSDGITMNDESLSSGNRLIALFVGGITWRKGVFYLLEAIRKITLKDVEFRFAGPDLGAGELLHAAAAHDPRIKWIGSLSKSDLKKEYQKADIFVFPSLLEGSAQVVCEAMSFGLPIITTKASGSFVDDGKEGFLVPSGNIEQLVMRIEQMYWDTEIRVRMGRCSLKKASSMTWESYRTEIKRIFS